MASSLAAKASPVPTEATGFLLVSGNVPTPANRRQDGTPD